MKPRPLLWMYRSMMGQMTLLALLFIGSLVYYFGIRPIITNRDLSDDPVQKTASEVTSRMSDFIRRTRTGEPGVVALEDDPVLRDVAARNPGFHYFVRVNDKEFRYGTAETYFHTLNFDMLAAERRGAPYPEVCTQGGRSLSGEEGVGSVSYSDCNGDLTYYEYAGLKTPLDLDASLVPYYPKWVWDSSRGMMISGAGMFLIFVLIVTVNVAMIRRITAVTRSFDPKHLDRKLPEEGLPSEVVPLVQAVNEMITKVDEAQRRREFFLSTAAHEMRTPLTVLRTRLEMLSEGELKDKLVGDVGRLTSLANQLLKLMSISGGRKLETLVDLVASARKVIAEREPLAELRGLRLELASEQATARVLGDQGLIEVAIANLLDNAMSFSPDGGRVELQIHAPATLVVRDHGPGIPPENLATLFEPFAKFPPNRNGHGLGLAIVKAAAELHGAEVSAANAADGGAAFTLAFPPLEG